MREGIVVPVRSPEELFEEFSESINNQCGVVAELAQGLNDMSWFVKGLYSDDCLHIEAPHNRGDRSIGPLLQKHYTWLEGVTPLSNVGWDVCLRIFIRVELGCAGVIHFGRSDKDNGWYSVLISIIQPLKQYKSVGFGGPFYLRSIALKRLELFDKRRSFRLHLIQTSTDTIALPKR
jgi:hypothetical protein